MFFLGQFTVSLKCVFVYFLIIVVLGVGNGWIWENCDLRSIYCWWRLKNGVDFSWGNTRFFFILLIYGCMLLLEHTQHLFPDIQLYLGMNEYILINFQAMWWPLGENEFSGHSHGHWNTAHTVYSTLIKGIFIITSFIKS